jgi:hypothetical protein
MKCSWHYVYIGTMSRPGLQDLFRSIGGLIDYNNSCRRADVTDDTLYTLGDLCALGPGKVGEAEGPRIYPPRWKLGGAIEQHQYDDLLGVNLLDIVSTINEQIEGARVVIAGGCAALPFNGKKNDIDIFIVTPATKKSMLWGILGDILKIILDCIQGQNIGGYHHNTTFTITPGVATICHFKDDIITKYQIMLRTYKTVAEILHGFDVGSCCVAFDGQTTWLTALGAYSQWSRTNIVVPAYRSPSYESRLGKYFRRGYALALPDLDPAAVVPGAELVLGGRLRLVIKDSATAVTKAMPEVSDYEGETGAEYSHEYRQCALALRSLCSDQNQLLAMTNLFSSEETDILSLVYDWDEKIPGTYGAMWNIERLQLFAKTQGFPCIKKGKVLVNVPFLTHNLGMTSEQVRRLTDRIIEVVALRPNDTYSFDKCMAPFIRRIQARFEEVKDLPVPWWVTENPSHQFTGSRDPRPSTPEEWYAAHYLREKARPVAQVRQDILPAEPKIVKTMNCAICLEVVTPGAYNTMILPCGHAMHLMKGQQCQGGFTWIRDRSACPICRRETTKVEGDESEVPPVEIDVDF